MKMSKRISFIFSLLLGFALAFLWLMPIAVEPNNAQTPTVNPRITPGSPLVIMLDNSGSMGKCPHKDAQGECTLGPEKQYRIDDAKKILSSILKESNFSSTKLGLVEFGNYQGYGKPWGERCKAVKTLAEPGFNNERKIIRALDKVKPNDDGVTPVTNAINFVVNNLKRKKILPAKILMISDGEPNCEDEFSVDLCGLIGTYVNADPPIELKLVIIGYKAKGKDSKFVECAKKYPGRVYYLGSASTPEELDDKIKEALYPYPEEPSSTSGTTVVTDTEKSGTTRINIVIVVIFVPVILISFVVLRKKFH